MREKAHHLGYCITPAGVGGCNFVLVTYPLVRHRGSTPLIWAYLVTFSCRVKVCITGNGCAASMMNQGKVSNVFLEQRRPRLVPRAIA